MKQSIFLIIFLCCTTIAIVAQSTTPTISGSILDEQTQESLIGATIYIEEAAFSKQHKPFFRLDTKITFSIPRPKVNHEFYINVDNVLNSVNVFTQYFSPQQLDLITLIQPKRFPSFQYAIQF